MRTLFGGILLAIGILVAGASGLCSLAFLVSMVTSSGGGEFASLPLVLVVGGIPFAIGLALFFAGRALIRSGRDN
jgi:hypothetical protein